jgi:hypothetical protein
MKLLFASAARGNLYVKTAPLNPPQKLFINVNSPYTVPNFINTPGRLSLNSAKVS